MYPTFNYFVSKYQAQNNCNTFEKHIDFKISFNVNVALKINFDGTDNILLLHPYLHYKSL